MNNILHQAVHQLSGFDGSLLDEGLGASTSTPANLNHRLYLLYFSLFIFCSLSHFLTLSHSLSPHYISISSVLSLSLSHTSLYFYIFCSISLSLSHTSLYFYIFCSISLRPQTETARVKLTLSCEDDVSDDEDYDVLKPNRKRRRKALNIPTRDDVSYVIYMDPISI